MENVGENSSNRKARRIRLTHIIEIFIVRQSSIIIRWGIIDSDNFVLSLPLAPAWCAFPRGNWSDSPILRGLLASPARSYEWFQSSRVRLGFLRVKAFWVNSPWLGLATFLACEIVAKITALVVERNQREFPRNEHFDAIKFQRRHNNWRTWRSNIFLGVVEWQDFIFLLMRKGAAWLDLVLLIALSWKLGHYERL